MLTGRCHCEAITYEMPSEVAHNTLCHCSDCRRHSGAPMVGWAMVPAARVTISGEPTVYASSEHGRRHFCGRCGTGLFYRNAAVFPGQVDLHTATLDDPDALPPSIRIQVADAPEWFGRFDALPAFPRYPG